MNQSLRGGRQRIEPRGLSLGGLMIVKTTRRGKLRCEPVRRRQVRLIVKAHRTNAFCIGVTIKNRQSAGRMNESIQEKRGAVTCIKAIGIAMALKPTCRRVVY